MARIAPVLCALLILACLYTSVHAQNDNDVSNSSGGSGSFPETYGVFIICEGREFSERVEARLFTSEEPLRVTARDCRRERVRGRAFGDSVMDHAALWRDQRNEFDELRDYFEELYLCDEDGRVIVERFSSSRYSSIYECGPAFEAHVVRFEYEG